MPEFRFKLDCSRYRKFEFKVIEELSKRYNVSISACAIRFADIGSHPIMVVYMENNKIEWKWQSEDFWFWNLIDADKKNVPEDSLAGKYFNSGSSQKRTEELWAIDWFEVLDVDLNCRIFEHVIPFRNKVLSIIWRK